MSYFYPNPRGLLGQKKVFDGECAAIPQQLVDGLKGHLVSEWRPGQRVLGNVGLRPGTAIAIFDRYGRYLGDKHHVHKHGVAHAGLYAGQSSEGIEIVHQYRTSGHIKGTLIRVNGRTKGLDGKLYGGIHSQGANPNHKPPGLAVFHSGVNGEGDTPEDCAERYFTIEIIGK